MVIHTEVFAVNQAGDFSNISEVHRNVVLTNCHSVLLVRILTVIILGLFLCVVYRCISGYR